MFGGRMLLSFLSFALLLNGSVALAQRFQESDPNFQARAECVNFINAHRQGEVSPTSVICDDPSVLEIYNDPTQKAAYQGCQIFLGGHRLGETEPASELCLSLRLLNLYNPLADRRYLRAFEACHSYFRAHTRIEGRPASETCVDYSVSLIFIKGSDSDRSAFLSCHRYLTQNWQGEEGRSPAAHCALPNMLTFFDADDTRTSRRSFDLCHRFWRTHRSLRGDRELEPASWKCGFYRGALWFDTAPRRQAYEQCSMFFMNHNRGSDGLEASCSESILELYMNSDNRAAFEACYTFISSRPQAQVADSSFIGVCQHEPQLLEVYRDSSRRARFEVCWQRSSQTEYAGAIAYQCIRQSSVVDDDREPTRSERRSHSASDH